LGSQSPHEKIKRPSWFATSLTNPSPWANVRAEEESAPLWIVDVYGKLKVENSVLANLYQELLNVRDQFLSEFQERDWSQTSVWELIAFLDDIAGIQTGVDTFLPKSLGGLSSDVKLVLYLLNFIIHGLAELEDNPTEDFGFTEMDLPLPLRALIPALRPLWFSTASPFVIQEFNRRRKEHLGSMAAVLFFGMEAHDQIKNSWARAFNLNIDQITQELARKVKADHLGPTHLEAHTLVLGELPEVCENLATNPKTKHRADPGEALARALMGEWDLCVLATQRRLQNWLRSEGRQEARDQTSQAGQRRRVEICFEEQEDMNKDIARTESSPLDIAMNNELMPSILEEGIDEAILARIKQENSKLKRYLEAWTPQKTQAQLAKELGVSEKTIRNWNKSLCQKYTKLFFKP